LTAKTLGLVEFALLDALTPERGVVWLVPVVSRTAPTVFHACPASFSASVRIVWGLCHGFRLGSSGAPVIRGNDGRTVNCAMVTAPPAHERKSVAIGAGPSSASSGVASGLDTRGKRALRPRSFDVFKMGPGIGETWGYP
jgi:hypothetical protein